MTQIYVVKKLKTLQTANKQTKKTIGDLIQKVLRLLKHKAFFFYRETMAVKTQLLNGNVNAVVLVTTT